MSVSPELSDKTTLAGVRKRAPKEAASAQPTVTDITSSTASSLLTRTQDLPVRMKTRSRNSRFGRPPSRDSAQFPDSSSSEYDEQVTGKPKTWFAHNKEGPPLTFKVELNLLWWLVMGVGFVSRFLWLHFPKYVIFDEVHFGKFASYYLQRSFFFDVHPPLGKLIFAAVGYLNDYDGSFLFPSIGLEFPHSVPYVSMRCAAALCGFLIIPCVYQIMVELGFSHKAALLASFFTIFDNSLVIQSRVIMLDSFVILFTYLSVLFYLKFYHLRHKPFSPSWHRGLIYTGFALGCLLGVKYTGILGLACVGLLTICDLWQLVGDHTIAMFDLFLHTLLRAFYLLGIPMLMNFVLFYIHFAILSQAGSGNSFVSVEFRKSLEGSVETPHLQLSPNATLLRYGSQFSLRSTEVSCWLHSHQENYPLKYEDGRGSSYQQQVTCYDFRDPNNLWVFRRPGDPNDPSYSNDDGPVRNKDLVELAHISTGKLLNSHDVAAPLSPSLQEVAGYINYSALFIPYLQWQLDVVGLEEKDPIYWEPGKLKLHLIHWHSKQTLSSTGKRLPEWGFQQYEVVTEREFEGQKTLWVMEELMRANISNSSQEREEEEELREAYLTRFQNEQTFDGGGEPLGFWDKYFELQHLMATAHSTLGDHTFGAPPQNWPLLGKTLPYWLDENTNAQVTLIGNPVLWWLGTGCIHVFLALTTFYLMRRRRMLFDLESYEFEKWWTRGSVLVVGWLVHYVPYFLLSRVLFLHHYLPALPFKFMLLAAVCEHGHTWARRRPQLLLPVYYLSVCLLCFCIIVSFFVFAPFSYGFPALSLNQILWRHWVSSWDLLHR